MVLCPVFPWYKCQGFAEVPNEVSVFQATQIQQSEWFCVRPSLGTSAKGLQKCQMQLQFFKLLKFSKVDGSMSGLLLVQVESTVSVFDGAQALNG
jgi:hypothetical protein